MKTNVVEFPVKNPRVENEIHSPPETEEELKQRKETFQKRHIDFLVNEIVPQTLSMIAYEGYDVNREEVLADVFTFSESLRSMLYKSLDYEHNIQKFADEYFTEYVTSQCDVDND